MFNESKTSSEEEKFIHENEIAYKDSLNTLLERKPSVLTMKNEWTTYSSIDVQHKILEYNTKLIQDYINSLLVPSWYRGVSEFQKESANRLLNAIRDDCAQRTTYRTMRCLESIGLDPLPTKKQLRTILQLCGGSDLALLWFLMEWLYHDTESNSYSVSEQLILTSIAHLDMNTTLKELDRILPPAQNTKNSDMSNAKRKLEGKRSSVSNRNEWKELPYFEKLPRPRNCNRTDIKDQQNFILNCSKNQIFNTSNTKANVNHQSFQKYSIQNSFPKEDNTNLTHFLANTLNENNVQNVLRQQEDIENLRRSFNIQLNNTVKNKVQEMALTFEKNKQIFKSLLKRFENDVETKRHDFNKLTKSFQKQSSSNLLSKESESINDNMSLLLKESKGNVSPISSSKICTNSSLAEDNDSKYFIAAQNKKPYKFDYCKIFPNGDKNSELQGGYSVLNELINQSQLGAYNFGDSENVLSSCIDNIWQQEVIKYQKTQFVANVEDSSMPSIIDYGLEYYDPDNDELMDKMLKDALDIMKRNHKFVFASIPGAHRFPLLREWIRLRYGKQYKKDDLAKSFKKSQPIFTALAKVGLPVELPSNADMGKDLITDYFCHDYIMRKSKHIRDEYYNRIDKAMLAQSRVIYFAMRPLLYSNDSLCNTIFAYMPAHKRENYHFRPWRLEECMKYKQVNYLQRQAQSSKRINNSGNRLTKKLKTNNSSSK